VSWKTIALTVFLAACASPGAPTPREAPAAERMAPVDPAHTPVPGAVWDDEGPLTWTPRPTVEEITANDLRTHLYQIAADSMRGRAAASIGNSKTAEYIAAEFRRLGLEPAGENGGYFQEILYGPLAYDRSAVRLAVQGTALDPGSAWVPMPPTPALEVAGAFSAEAVPTVYGGTWGDSAVAIDASEVAGKAVVFLLPPRDPNNVVIIRGRRFPAPMARDLRAQAAGAALVILVSDSLPASVVGSSFNERTTLMPYVTSKTAGARLSAAAAERLFGRALGELDVGAEGAALAGRWRYEYHRPEYPARNVIAVLPGSDPALRDEYVLVGAHNDHVGMVRGGGWVDHDSLRAFNKVMRPQGANDRPGAPTAEQQGRIDSLIAYARSIRPPRRDSVMNGADDDGSGTVVLLEIAERFATRPAPARSILFISHVAEERGLLGSRYFTNHPTVPLSAIVAAHNMDMLGKGRVTDVKFGGPSSVQMLGARRLSAEFGDVIDSLNAVRDETMAIDYSWDRTNKLNRFCRSDQVNYFRHTIPVTYFSLGYAVDYHQATDEPQYIDYEHGARLGRFIYDIMRTIADRPTRLRVLPLEERDLSAQCTR
jgi:Peptidase family M28